MLQSAAYLQKGDKKGVESSLKNGIEKNPKSTLLYLSLADFYVREKQVNDAISVIQKIIVLEPKDMRHKLTLAGLYWDSGKEDQASEVLKNLLAADEKNEEQWVQNAGFFISRNKITDAEKVLKEGLQKHSKSLKIRFALSDLYVNTNRVDDAVALLKECLTIKKDSKDPEVIQAKNSLAKIYLTRQETAEAKKLIDDVIKNSPKNVEAHFLKGNILLLQGDGTGAVSEFRTVTNERPQFIPAYLKLAEAHIATRELNLALDTLQKALKIDPDSKDALRATGRIYLMQGDYKKAEEYMKKLAGTNPDDIDIKADLGDLFAAQKNYKEAENAYSDIKRKAPKNPFGYIKMGGLYASQGKPDKAVTEFEQAYKLNPQSAQIFTVLVQSYMDNKKFADAVALCEGKIRENPKEPFCTICSDRFTALRRIIHEQRNYFKKRFLSSQHGRRRITTLPVCISWRVRPRVLFRSFRKQ